MAAWIRTLGLIAAGTFVVGLVAGCGSDGDAGDVATDGSATPSASAPSPSDDTTADSTPSPAEESDSVAPASWPACADVWSEGATLPKPYPGCSLGGTAVPADSIRCSMGALLVTYDDRFWGVPGNEISRADRKLQQDADYRQTRATCTA